MLKIKRKNTDRAGPAAAAWSGAWTADICNRSAHDRAGGIANDLPKPVKKFAYLVYRFPVSLRAQNNAAHDAVLLISIN